MLLSSPVFVSRAAIPKIYTGDGDDLSPPLQWDHVPENTAEFALICEDTDSPTFAPWVHWVLYKIPGDQRELHVGAGSHTGMRLDDGVLQGRNSWKSGETIGYRGPAPPRGGGVHRYHFRLYALEQPINLPPQATREEVLHAIRSFVLAESDLMGTYQRL